MKKLKEYRKRLGLTQEEVAKILGLTTQTYQNYELGRRQPDNATLLKMADFYNITLDEMFDRKNNQFVNLNFLSDEERNIINALKQLNRENLIKVETYTLLKLEDQNK